MKTRKWRKTEKDSLLRAQTFFQDQDYLLALPIFEKLEQSHPKELYLKYVMGICGLYRSDVHQKSLEYLEIVYAKNKKAAGIRYDLARANHYNNKFDEALLLLEEYLKDKKITERERKDAEQLVEYCNNAKILVASPVDAKIENIGDILNTVGSEYVPVITSDESVIIYTYTGDQSVGGLQNGYNQADSFGIYYEDVFISHKENGNWVSPSSIGTNINTNIHDAAIAISNDGQKLFVFKDNSYDGGDIYISKLDTTNWSLPEKLNGDVNTAAWEGSASLSSDEKTLYFSSERPGGFGGRDLYKASLLADGSWGNIKNLGEKVNTRLDDDAPFIHPDGKTLIYSSQGLNSMGSYDIFLTEYSASDSSWSTPKNLGYPINTPDDDRYFVLSTDGNRGYYASGKEGGFGLHDIYVVDMPNDFVKPNVMMVKGVTFLDDKPVFANVEVDIADRNERYRSINTHATDGGYLVNLVSGQNYKITYKLKGFPDQTKTIEAMTLNGYTEKIIDIKFSTKVDSAKIDSTAVPTLAKTDSTKTTPSATFDSGNFSKDGLEFKVQIAAYNLPKNYRYDYLKGLGNVEKLLLDDGITRFTIGGSFKTLNDAIAHKNKVKEAGQKDAFVTAIYQGKRVYLEDLEKLGLIPAVPK
ncbi:MAG: PD40 domain-containing protein [Bacteroidetes bacterium]|nr:PD40 domain-containing protein [Bacteroidota bacterium]